MLLQGPCQRRSKPPVRRNITLLHGHVFSQIFFLKHKSPTHRQSIEKIRAEVLDAGIDFHPHTVSPSVASYTLKLEALLLHASESPKHQLCGLLAPSNVTMQRFFERIRLGLVTSIIFSRYVQDTYSTPLTPSEST